MPVDFPSPKTLRFDSVRQEFTFNNQRLTGILASFSGQTKRRMVVQEFPKRAGAVVEDMNRGPRRLEVRLIFVGPTCANDFTKFEQDVQQNPVGLLIHPIAGKWQAFCEGPTHQVEFSRAVNEIQVTVGWTETSLDSDLPREVPDVATSAQSATAAQVQFQQSSAGYMGAIAKVSSASASARASLDRALAQIAGVSAPLTFMRQQVDGVARAGSAIIATVAAIEESGAALAVSVTNFVDAATDVFNGSDVLAGSSDSTATLLGIVQTDAEKHEATLVASSPTPAGSVEAVSDVELSTDACLTLSDALQAARPPVILFTVPAMTDVITLAQQRYRRDALQYASQILAMNRIPNPAAIPAGTQLFIPSR
jgi:prophage DNA circulation protein